MKNKGLLVSWYERLIPDKDYRELLLVILIVIALVIGVVVILVVVLSEILPSPIETYQQVYSDCMTHIGMTKYQCHQIALQVVGD